jgi:uncharacterized lipoprotein YddW (UPF0748 family)/N-acetylmuramoyl-L-alanine amidase
MRKLKFPVACLLSIALLLPSGMVMAAPTTAVNTTSGMKGLWVATVYNIDYPTKGTVDSALLKREAITILDKAESAGLNAVFLQVRPASDALYVSNYFPWSKYLTGKQGLAPNEGFDPLAFWVDEAHLRGLELHAWINPYRITKKGSKDPNHDFASLTATHPARVHPEWVVKHTDGNLYFNPGIPAVRQLIVDSSLEIIQNYQVDGVHFDDYFYPGQVFADADTYKLYGSAFKSIHDWRRDNVNLLIQSLATAIDNTGKKVSFGISPFGIWANKATNALGSDTKGQQSYYDHYADTRKWVLDGTIDYIAPQIYWNIGFTIADYAKILSWWQNVVKGTGVKLYIGHAAYRVGNTDATSPWSGVEEIRRQLDLNVSTGGVDGSIFYNYSAFRKFPALTELLKQYFSQGSTQVPVVVPSHPAQPITFARPTGNIKTRLGTYFICGTSDPALPLMVNGIPVEGRSSKGYYGYFATLKPGVNTFIFSQGNTSKTLVLTKDISVTKALPMKTIEIPVATAFPQAQEERLSGEKVTLTCQAPIGATVTVKLAGESYPMKPAIYKINSKSAYVTTYTYSYTLPTYTGTPRTVNLGKPVYAMSYKGTTKTRTAAAPIGVIMKDAPYYAMVNAPIVDTYKTPTTANGAATEVYQGMVDRVTGVTGSYIRLASGLWLKKDKAALYTNPSAIQGVVNSTHYQTGKKWDALYFDLSHSALAIPSFDGTTLRLELSGVQTLMPIELPADSLFELSTYTVTNGNGVYTLKLKSGEFLDGFSVHTAQNVLVLDLKRRPVLSTYDAPLSGITVLLDPGHGGSDTGALGPLGAQYAEKHINLAIAKKVSVALQAMGASVQMTRSEDVAVSLSDRLSLSRQLKPDLFISIHADSVADSADINKIFGFSVFYKEKIAADLSKRMLDGVVQNLGRKDRGVNVKNFYVTRGTWAPSLLLETGFVPNPIEFEWLSEESSQTQLAEELAKAILAYFAR